MMKKMKLISKETMIYGETKIIGTSDPKRYKNHWI